MQKLKSASGENRSGFTLIELSLSLVFIGILSLAVAYVISDTIGSYRRGLTLSQINMTGIDLVDDMRKTIQDSPVKSPVEELCSKLKKNSNKCKDDGAEKFINISVEDEITVKGNNKLTVPIYGAFCTGKYSYVWNSGYLFASGSNVGKAIFYKGDEEIKDFRLLRVEDASRAVCASVVNENYEVIKNKKEFRIEDGDAEVIDLLSFSESDGGLALYDLNVPVPARDKMNSSALYSVSFILGTVQGGINIKKSGGFCATPGEYEGENFDYCAINKFNFAVLATGGL